MAPIAIDGGTDAGAQDTGHPSYASFEEFYQDIWPRMARVVKAGVPAEMSPDDALHDAFLAVYENHRKTAWLPDRKVAMAYVYKIVQRNISRHYRVRTESPAGSSREVAGVPHAEVVEDVATNVVDSMFVKFQLDKLSDVQREIVKLRYLEDLPVEAIAEIVDIAPRTVHVYLRTALSRLQPFKALPRKVRPEPQPETRYDQAISAMPVRRREVLERHLRGLRPVAIADELGITPNCARVNLNHAYTDLANRLGVDRHTVMRKLKRG